MHNLFKIILLCTLFLLNGNKEQPEITRKNSCSVSWKATEVIPHYIDFQDTLSCDTIFESVSSDGLPVSYFRNIRTGVCVAGKCRLISIRLYWNVTGRYLGFELPNGEFLSKTEHVPFINQEYDKLNQLLADPDSKLAHYAIGDLAPEAHNGKVDGITSATISEVLESVVKGAVYTTYSLWHLVYGRAKTEAENLTLQKLNNRLILEILSSPDVSDRIWILNHFSPDTRPESQVISRLLELVNHTDIYLAERALNAMPVSFVSLDTVQQQLVSVFKQTGFVQKRLILQKFTVTPVLSLVTVNELAGSLNDLSGILVVQVLDLFRKKGINQKAVGSQVMNLLENKNRFISEKAYRFLTDFPDKSKEMIQALKKYEKQR
jgi:hypothetical protein